MGTHCRPRLLPGPAHKPVANYPSTTKHNRDVGNTAQVVRMALRDGLNESGSEVGGQ